MRKQEFYSLGATVDRYEQRRFGGKSGRHVHERELRTVLELLPAGGKLLDVPVGTGRLSLFLQQHGFDCHGVDYSQAMIDLARSRGLTNLSQGDVFQTPLPAASFDCAASLRFFFHFRDVLPVLANVFGALKPGGVYVLDTFNRSPRAWLPFLGESGRVHLHPPEQFARLARDVGFEIAGSQPCYVFSPLVYRFLPFPVVQALDRVEQRVPGEWLARVFWKLQKPARAGARA
jgi:ubiquinone/menaquinone biosynthesis C-methylase UbiE